MHYHPNDNAQFSSKSYEFDLKLSDSNQHTVLILKHNHPSESWSFVRNTASYEAVSASDPSHSP